MKSGGELELEKSGWATAPNTMDYHPAGLDISSHQQALGACWTWYKTKKGQRNPIAHVQYPVEKPSNRVGVTASRLGPERAAKGMPLFFLSLSSWPRGHRPCQMHCCRWTYHSFTGDRTPSTTYIVC